MRHQARRRRFRAILEGGRCLAPASVFDPFTARMAEDLGFEAGMLAGSIASYAALGAPDLLGMTQTEFAALCHRICRAGDLSLLVDADDGFGNALNVMRTVEELETAGIAAMTLEDTRLPLPHGRPSADHLISLEEGVGKMKAALAARSDPNFIIVGRTSAAGITGVEDAIQRLQAYAAAGVDAIFPVGVKTRADLEAIHAAVDSPMVFYIASETLSDLDYLQTQGVKIALQGHAPFAAAMNAAYETLKALRGGIAPSDLPGLPKGGLMKDWSRQSDYDARIDAYLK